MASEWQTVFVVSPKIRLSSRPRPRPNVQDQDHDFMTQDQDQDFHFVREAPRDQHPGLGDYINVSHIVRRMRDKLLEFNLRFPIITYGLQA